MEYSAATSAEARVNLTVDTVVPYLLEHRLLRASEIVAGDLEIVDVGRRNQNLRIIRRRGPSYLLKQAGVGEPAAKSTVRSEARFYDRFATGDQSSSNGMSLPRLHYWDEARSLLVAELIEGTPLWTHYAGIAPEAPSRASAELGRALGVLHRSLRGSVAPPDPWIADLPSDQPWIFFAHRPTPELYTRLSPANLQVLRLIQADSSMVAAFDGLRRQWTADTLIHNDLKGDNVLVVGSDDSVSVRVVDWELVQVGDAAWDVGSVFRDYLHFWLLSVHLSGDLTAEQMSERAQVPLADLRPAIRAFWNAYHHAADIDAESRATFLLRAIGYAAARLAQGAYELSLSTHQPPNYAYAMLQVSANILADPRDASLHLLGIPVPWRGV